MSAFADVPNGFTVRSSTSSTLSSSMNFCLFIVIFLILIKISIDIFICFSVFLVIYDYNEASSGEG